MIPTDEAPVLCRFLEGLLRYHDDNNPNEEAAPRPPRRTKSPQTQWETKKSPAGTPNSDVNAFVYAVPESIRLRNGRRWTARPALHAQALCCAPEIRRHINVTESERWSSYSLRIAANLEAPGLLRADGRWIVWSWIEYSERLLHTIDYACRLESNSHGQGRTGSSPPEADKAYRVLSEILERDPTVRTAKSQILIKKAKVNRQAALSALRRLAGEGRYEGFQREAVAERSHSEV